MITAAIDFADEEIPDDVAAGVHERIADVRCSIAAQLDGYPAAELLRRGFEVALVGAPNAGKSSLLNAIARRDIAIVTDIPGTTRDIVEFRADLHGLPVTFLDTAGVRDSADLVEGIGISRAVERARKADLRIFVGTPPDEMRPLQRSGDIFVETKGDLTGLPGALSSVTGAGVEELLERIFLELRGRVSGKGLASHERQADALRQAEYALTLDQSAEPEIVGEALRLAGMQTERLLGRIDAEDYLDRVFSTFCVGK